VIAGRGEVEALKVDVAFDAAEVRAPAPMAKPSGADGIPWTSHGQVQIRSRGWQGQRASMDWFLRWTERHSGCIIRVAGSCRKGHYPSGL
jgi:hypothetical protein